MNCPELGTLKSNLDGALPESEHALIESHLGTCPACRGRVDELLAQSNRVGAHLASLTPPASQHPADARVALAHFRSRTADAPATGVGRWFAWRPRPAWGGAFAALAAAVLLVAFPSTRGWAQGILARLRIEKVAVIPFDRTALPKEERQAAKLIAEMISNEVVVDKEPGEAQHVLGVEEASRLAGFHVRSVKGHALQPEIRVQDEAAYRLTVDLDRLDAILQDAGRADIALPRSLDGATISMQLPKIVYVTYGDCHNKRDECTAFIQARSPTVNLPPGLDIRQIAEAGLQFGGMNAKAAHEFSETIDWASTLVIPVPRDTGSAETVEVDGVKGTLMSNPQWGRKHAARYHLIWVKDGIVHSLLGPGDGQGAVELARTIE